MSSPENVCCFRTSPSVDPQSGLQVTSSRIRRTVCEENPGYFFLQGDRWPWGKRSHLDGEHEVLELANSEEKHDREIPMASLCRLSAVTGKMSPLSGSFSKQAEIPGDMDLAKKLLKLEFQQQQVTFEDENEIRTESQVREPSLKPQPSGSWGRRTEDWSQTGLHRKALTQNKQVIF